MNIKKYRTTAALSFAVGIIIALLIAGCAGPKQTAGINDTSAPSSAEVIVAHTDMQPEAAYRRAAQVLQDQGFTFRNTDEALQSISTDFASADNGEGISLATGAENTSIRLSTSVRGEQNAKVVMRGWYRTLNSSDEEGSTISKFGQNGSPTRGAWKRMHNIASTISDSLSYR